MWPTTFVAAWLALSPMGVSQTASPDLVLEISLSHYGAGERRHGWAGDSGSDALQSYVWTDEKFCSLGASDSELVKAPAFGWHFQARVLQRTGTEFVVGIEWQRRWENSARLTGGPKGSLTLTLRPGARIELDRIEPQSPSPCGVTSVRLEAAIDAPPARGFWIGPGGGGGEGGRSSLGAGRGRAGVVGGGGGRISVGSSSPPLFDAELWLVHRLPSGSEDVQRQVFAFGSDGSEFAFPPVPIATTRGSVGVEVTGRLSARLVNGTASALDVLIARRARGDGQPPMDSMGGSTKTIAVPAASDVISFELPPPHGSTDLLAGHQFSLRLRVTAK